MPPEGIGGVMMAFEHSGLSHAARSTGWLYPLANLSHVLGAALVVGAIATFDIQVLRRAQNVGVIASAVTPVAAFGLALVNIAAFRWRFGGDLRAETPLDGATGLAALSLASWLLVLLAGRFIAYL